MNKRLIIILLSFFISLTISCQNKKIKQFEEVRRPYKTISPQISNLLKIDNDSLKTEVQKIWLSAKQNGLPLIEEDPLDPDYKYVTIVYQDSAKNKDITFDVFGIYDEYRFGDMRLRQLGNTDLYYRCYKVPTDICFSYRFNINDTLTGKEYKVIDKYNTNRIPMGEVRNLSYSVLKTEKKLILLFIFLTPLST